MSALNHRYLAPPKRIPLCFPFAQIYTLPICVTNRLQVRGCHQRLITRHNLKRQPHLLPDCACTSTRIAHPGYPHARVRVADPYHTEKSRTSTVYPVPIVFKHPHKSLWKVGKRHWIRRSFRANAKNTFQLNLTRVIAG